MALDLDGDRDHRLHAAIDLGCVGEHGRAPHGAPDQRRLSASESFRHLMTEDAERDGGGAPVDDTVCKYAGADIAGGDAQNAVKLCKQWATG